MFEHRFTMRYAFGIAKIVSVIGCVVLASVALWVWASGWRSVSEAADDPSLVPGRFGEALDGSRGGHLAEGRAEYGAYSEGTITIEFWARLSMLGTPLVLVANDSEASGSHWALRTGPDGALELRLSGAKPSEIRSQARLEVGRWHHITAVLSPHHAKVLLDGRVVAEEVLQIIPLPKPVGALAVACSLEDRRRNPLAIDDLRISTGHRSIVAAPESPQVLDERTLVLLRFDESEADYLARWTPGGETNQRNLPYPHRYAAYEFEKDNAWLDIRWHSTDKGPFLSHSIEVPLLPTGPKGMVVFFDTGDEDLGVVDYPPAVLFDLERCAVVAGFSEADLSLHPRRFGLLRKPILDGTRIASVPGIKAWRTVPLRSEERPEPLEREAIDYRGLHLHGDQVLWTYEIAGTPVRETTTIERHDDRHVLGRHLEVQGLSEPVYWTVAESSPETSKLEQVGDHFIVVVEDRNTREIRAFAWLPRDEASSPIAFERLEGDVALRIPADLKAVGTLWAWSGTSSELESFGAFLDADPETADFDVLARPTTGRWGEPLVTSGTLGVDDGQAPYLIDTIGLPGENRFRALFFVSAFAFFPNGDAALATAHGDVWIVRGLDDDLDEVTWTRHATGLYQPLGLEIVDGRVIVLGRDQLTRLHDRNDDGEADFYESFNHDLQIEGRPHAFAMRLETDTAGNFYFLKSGSDPPHGSSLLKLSADGSQLEVLARGFRHAFGLGVGGPDGWVTVADNEGNWVPSSKIDRIVPGGFYGFLGNAEPMPDQRPEPPLCYIPKVADNSSGGQVWVEGDRWGDYHRDEMLHLSWGRCTLHAVLRERVGDRWQGATVRFPGLAFESGAAEANFSPRDGQLYVVGLDGWQTGAVRDGCLQRVRATGRPNPMPSGFRTYRDGIALTFHQVLDPERAEDVDRYRAEHWNYRWSETYGSFHYRPSDPEAIGHEPLPITSARLLEDGRTVFLSIPEIRPVDQLQIATDLRTLDGQPARFDVYLTIHALGDEPGPVALGAGHDGAGDRPDDPTLKGSE